MLLPHSVVGSQTNDPYFNNVSLLLSARDGIIKDYSKNNHAISVVGNTAISSAQAKWGNKSIYFDGNGDYLDTIFLSDLILNGDFTIEIWVTASNSVSGYTSCILSAQTTGAWNANGCGLRLHHDNLIIGADTSKQINFTLLQNSVVANLIIKRTSGIVSLYLNGILAGSVSYSGIICSSDKWGVGFSDRAYGAPREFFNGFVHELRITKGIARTISVPTQPYPNW